MTKERPDVRVYARYNTAETCEALGICYNTLVRHLRAGRIHSVLGSDGKSRRFTGAEIMRFWRSW